ncbi:uncharacterized protein METZ01_LOCUS69706 [marine metagenome]|uniref:Uncharacterized protein n=1 Tax=marine metagenome TaxID=408172 RepID=A0A381TL94_9ZZZZ
MPVYPHLRHTLGWRPLWVAEQRMQIHFFSRRASASGCL